MATNHNDQALLQYSNLQIPQSQVVLVYTEWNTAIIDELREGVKRVLAAYPQITLTEICVPGAIEISFAIRQHYFTRHAHAYIALGCVIRGGTPHFDYVCQSITQGITHLNTEIGSPVIFGILTVNQASEAWERLGGVHGHKGEEAGIAALKMIHFSETLKQG